MPRRYGCTSPRKPTKHEWLPHRPAVRQWYLVEGFTGNEVAEKLATTRGFYVKGSQVGYRARRWGLRKRLPMDTASSGTRTGQNSQSTVFEQRDGDDDAASHQTNTELNLLSEQTQPGSVWAAGESDTSCHEHIQVSASSGPSFGATPRWDHHTAGVTPHPSWTSQHDGDSLDDVDSHWMMAQDKPSSQRSHGLQGHNDPGASVDNVAEGLFEPRGHQAGFFDSSHNNNGFTELGIDPLSFPWWDPINTYSESQFAYDSDAESRQEDTQ